MNTIADNWLDFLTFLGLTCFAISFLIQFTYAVRLSGLKKRTEKYRFATEYESKSLRKASNVFAFGVGVFSFHAITLWLGNVQPFQYIFVGFFSGIISFAIGYTLWTVLKYYYPHYLEKRLNRIRFKPMKSQETGNPMRLLSEDEEDAHLTEQMMEEEEAFSADYDVWIDEKTGHKVIEKYDTHYHALICEACNFRTLKDVKEEIIKSPTLSERGKLAKHYKCSYCGHTQTMELSIPSWSEENEMVQIEEAVE